LVASRLQAHHCVIAVSPLRRRRGAGLLPFGTERNDHVWLHARCQETWYAGRKAKAVAALAEFGISYPRRITAAEAINRRLVFEYVTGKMPAADE
jgi:hypothetical protein